MATPLQEFTPLRRLEAKASCRADAAGWPCAVCIMEVIRMYLVAEREREREREGEREKGRERGKGREKGRERDRDERVFTRKQTVYLETMQDIVVWPSAR